MLLIKVSANINVVCLNQSDMTPGQMGLRSGRLGAVIRTSAILFIARVAIIPAGQGPRYSHCPTGFINYDCASILISLSQPPVLINFV